MKAKRTLSMLLSLLMVFSLFAGITPKAQANDRIADLLEDYLFKKDALDTLLGEGNLVKQGYCGKDPNGGSDPSAYVWYQIYQVDTQELMNSQYFQTLSDYAEDGYLPLEPTEDYYAVKIFGNGDMFDYKRNQSAPWCDKVTLTWGPHAGEVVDMDKKLVLAYVAGSGYHKSYSEQLGRMVTPEDPYTGVTNVGQFAFFGQDNLYGAFLGETVKRIEDRAFESTETLAAINAPSALEYLGKRAFYGCDKLTFFRAGSTKLTEIGERAFYGNSLLTSVQFPANLKVIGKMAFAWCRMLGDESFALPSGLTTISDGAFMFDTHLGRVNEINFPKNVTYIGNYAFLCCFGIGSGEDDGISFTAGGTQPLSIGNYAFAGCRQLKNLKLDNRVTNIHTGAFAACERLETVVFGNDQNAKRVAIDENAFTSAQSTVVNALDYISAYTAESGDEYSEFIPTANYDDEELQAFTNLTAMTPLRDAAFQNRPASTVKAASDALSHSFPVDCVIHYPTASYNPSANAEWLGALDASSTTWKGYPTQGDWTGHFHNYEATVTKEATHTQDGLITYTCSVCKQSYTEVVPKGHAFEEYNRQEPTCTEDGVVVYHCTRDGCSYPNGFYTETLPALGHDDKTVVTIKEPTCTEDGLRQGYCSRCQQYINEVLPAKGHNLAMMTVVEPKCNKDGYAYGFCVDCHQWISKDDPIILPATGAEHQWDSGKVTTQPTCEAEGVRTYTCTVCGDTKTEAIAATGHDWGAWTVTKQPTRTQPGEKQRVCKNDPSHIEKEAIPPTGGEDWPFKDVTQANWFYEHVKYCYDNGLMNGITADTFAPQRNTTRAEFATVIWRLEGSPAPTGANPFADCQTHWSKDAVAWAFENGIVNGIDATHFAPNNNITREQMVTMLYRYVGEPPVTGNLNAFTDAGSVSAYARSAMIWGVQNGVITGRTATTLAPKGLATRAELATILHRFDLMLKG